MGEINSKKKEANNKDGRSTFWMLFFFLIIPVIGIVIEFIAFKLENVILMLIALPMLLSFFITAGVIIVGGIKAAKQTGVDFQDDADEFYENNLNISEKAILAYEENPYKRDAIKSFVIILSAVFLPIFAAYLLDDSELMIFGLYVKNICSALPILLGQ